MKISANNTDMIILTRDEWARQLAEAYQKGAEDERKASATISPMPAKCKKAVKLKAKGDKAVEWRGAVVTDGEGE